MKTLFIMTALIEGMTGLVFLLLPDLLVSVLIGVSLDTRAGLVIGRLSGAAVLSLSLGCWLARNDIYSRAAVGIVRAMLLYNVISVMLLTYAYIGLRFCGAGLWPAVILHLALGTWCIVCLKQASKPTEVKETK